MATKTVQGAQGAKQTKKRAPTNAQANAQAKVKNASAPPGKQISAKATGKQTGTGAKKRAQTKKAQ